MIPMRTVQTARDRLSLYSKTIAPTKRCVLNQLQASSVSTKRKGIHKAVFGKATLFYHNNSMTKAGNLNLPGRMGFQPEGTARLTP